MKSFRGMSIMLAGMALASLTGCGDSNPSDPAAAGPSGGNRGKSTNQLMSPSYVQYEVGDELIPAHTVHITIQGKPTSGGYFVDIFVEDWSSDRTWSETWFKYGDAPQAGDEYFHDEIRIRLDDDGDGMWDWEDPHPNNPDHDNPDDEDCNGPRQD